MKKFKLTTEYITTLKRKLFRIQALVNFGNVEAGEFGGYIEKEENLSHDGDAQVCGNAWVCGGAKVCSNGDYTTVGGLGRVYRTTTFFSPKKW